MSVSCDYSGTGNCPVQCMCSSLVTLPGGLYHRTVDSNKGGVSICLVGLNYKMLLKNYRYSDNKENLRLMELEISKGPKQSASCPRMQTIPKNVPVHFSVSAPLDKLTKPQLSDGNEPTKHVTEGRNKNVQFLDFHSHTALLIIRNESSFRPREVSAFNEIDSLSLACDVCKHILASAKQIWLQHYRKLRCKSIINVCIKCGEGAQSTRFCPFCVFTSTVNCSEITVDMSNELFRLISCLKSHSNMCKKARTELEVGLGSCNFERDKDSKRHRSGCIDEQSASQLSACDSNSGRTLVSQVLIDHCCNHENTRQTSKTNKYPIRKNAYSSQNTHCYVNDKQKLSRPNDVIKCQENHPGNIKPDKIEYDDHNTPVKNKTLPDIASRKKIPERSKYHKNYCIDVVSAQIETIMDNQKVKPISSPDKNAGNVGPTSDSPRPYAMKAFRSSKSSCKKPTQKICKARNKRQSNDLPNLNVDNVPGKHLNGNKVYGKFKYRTNIAYTMQGERSTDIKNPQLLHGINQLGFKTSTSLKCSLGRNVIFGKSCLNEEIDYDSPGISSDLKTGSVCCITTYQNIFAKAQMFRRCSVDLDEIKRADRSKECIVTIDATNYDTRKDIGDMSVSEFSEELPLPQYSFQYLPAKSINCQTENPEANPKKIQCRPSSAQRSLGSKTRNHAMSKDLKKKSMHRKKELSQKCKTKSASPNLAFRYKLSDLKYVENGWTRVPIDSNYMEINIYKCQFTEENNWFDYHHNKALYYDTGEKLSDCDDMIYYKNGQVALRRMKLEGVTVYELYELHPENTYRKEIKSKLIGVIDGLGNCIVFDNVGNVRIQYNQHFGYSVLAKPNKWQWYIVKEEKQFSNLESMVNEISKKSRCVEDVAEMEVIKLKPIIVRINEKLTLRIRSQNDIWLTYIEGLTTIKLSLSFTIDNAQLINVLMCYKKEMVEPLGNDELFLSVNKGIKKLKKIEKDRIKKLCAIYGSHTCS